MSAFSGIVERAFGGASGRLGFRNRRELKKRRGGRCAWNREDDFSRGAGGRVLPAFLWGGGFYNKRAPVRQCDNCYFTERGITLCPLFARRCMAVHSREIH